MAKQTPFEYLLSCNYSSHPGGDWYAWVGFRPTNYGYSIWIGGYESQEEPSYRKKVAHRKKPLTFKNACEDLRSLSDGAIYGNLWSEIDVDGASQFEGQVLALCWPADSDISTDVLSLLVDLPDEELVWLGNALGGDLTSDQSLNLLRDNHQHISTTPRELWNKYYPPTEKGDLAKLMQRIEDEEDALRVSIDDDIRTRLSPFTKEIDRLVLAKTKAPKAPESNNDRIVREDQSRNLRSSLKEYVLQHARTPARAEFEQLWDRIKKAPVPIVKWGKTLYYLNKGKQEN